MRHLLLLSVVLAFTTTVQAEDLSGRTAKVTKESEMRIEDRVVQRAAVGERLVIKKTQGEWYWVTTTAGVTGWIHGPDLELLSPESALEEPRAPGDEKLLLIGAMSTPYLYTTYAYLGATADGLRRDIYTGNQVQERTEEVRKMCVTVEVHMKKLVATELAPSDKAAIEQMLGCLTLLQKQSAALAEFAKSGKRDGDESYIKAAKRTWQAISTVATPKE